MAKKTTRNTREKIIDAAWKPPQLPPLLALKGDLPQQPVVGAVAVHQGLVPPGNELGGVQPGQLPQRGSRER